MWKEPDDKGASVVHVLNVVEECMRWSRKHGGAHEAVAQDWKEVKEGGSRWACVQACSYASVVDYHHLNIIRCFKGYNTIFYKWGGQSTLDMLGGYIDFLICHISKTTLGGYLNGFQ
jgi:hypothetical protein